MKWGIKFGKINIFSFFKINKVDMFFFRLIKK